MERALPARPAWRTSGLARGAAGVAAVGSPRLPSSASAPSCLNPLAAAEALLPPPPRLLQLVVPESPAWEVEYQAWQQQLQAKYFKVPGLKSQGSSPAVLVIAHDSATPAAPTPASRPRIDRARRRQAERPVVGAAAAHKAGRLVGGASPGTARSSGSECGALCALPRPQVLPKELIDPKRGTEQDTTTEGGSRCGRAGGREAGGSRAGGLRRVQRAERKAM